MPLISNLHTSVEAFGTATRKAARASARHDVGASAARFGKLAGAHVAVPLVLGAAAYEGSRRWTASIDHKELELGQDRYDFATGMTVIGTVAGAAGTAIAMSTIPKHSSSFSKLAIAVAGAALVIGAGTGAWHGVDGLDGTD